MKINFFKHKNQNCYIAQNGDSYILKSAEKQKRIKAGDILVLPEKSLENIFLGNFS